jgi:hypothetical protein
MNTFTTREDWLAQAIAELRSVFSALNHPLPDNIRVACGFPSSNARSAKNRAVGEHWSARASADQHHEILISPVVDDPVRVLGILVHELAHASTDGDGHKGRFPALVKALSLEGKPTATTWRARSSRPSTSPSWMTLVPTLTPSSMLGRTARCKALGCSRPLALTAGIQFACLPSGPAVGLPECPVDGAELILS